MNRVNIDNNRFVDFDELVLMEIVEFKFEVEKNTLKTGFRVDGITKNGLRIESLFVEKQSEKPTRCETFVANNWLNAKK